MSKSAYIGVSGTARKVKKIYVGVSGTARKVKKGYIGVGGVARQFFSGGELAYYGRISLVGSSNLRVRATTVGKYAVFGGFYNSFNSNELNIIKCVNSSLTVSARTLTVGRTAVAAETAGNYAVFFSGQVPSSGVSSVISSVVDSCSSSLTVTAISNATESRANACTASVGDYAIFLGGTNTSEETGFYGYKTEVYDGTLTHSTPSGLSAKKLRYSASASVGDYAVVAGGGTYRNDDLTVRKDVMAISSSLTQTSPQSLSVARELLAATTIGGNALFGGGATASSYASVVESYNSELTRTIISPLSSARKQLGASTVGDFALFVGGYGSTVTDAYDRNLVRTTPTPLSSSTNYTRERMSTTVGDCGIFGDDVYTA